MLLCYAYPLTFCNAYMIQIVLVGDPCQLGPVLSSRLASSSGLGVSLLERVMEMRSYCRQEEKFKDHGSYDPLLV